VGEYLVIVLFAGCVGSVPIAGFSLAVLYTKAGFSPIWTIALCIVGAVAIYGVVSVFGVFGDGNNGLTFGVGTFFGVGSLLLSAILVTLSAVMLAFRRWPALGIPK